MSKLFFKEEQKFGLRMYLIIIPVFIFTAVIFGIGLYKQLYLGEPWGDEPMTDNGLIATFLVVITLLITIAVLFGRMKLITEIRDDGLYFRYIPFINKFRVFKPDMIEKYEVRKYRAIREYGGYGIKGRKPGRRGRKYGMAYNVSGNTGLQIYLKNGNKVLIGTQRGEAIKYAMDKMMKAAQ